MTCKLLAFVHFEMECMEEQIKGYDYPHRSNAIEPRSSKNAPPISSQEIFYLINATPV